jgi:hypothetical protein
MTTADSNGVRLSNRLAHVGCFVQRHDAAIASGRQFSNNLAAGNCGAGIAVDDDAEFHDASV